MQLVKVHHLINNVEKETMYQSHKKLAAYSDQSFCTGTAVSSNTKCLKDILTESQSDTHSCTSSSMDECSPEVILLKENQVFRVLVCIKLKNMQKILLTK